MLILVQHNFDDPKQCAFFGFVLVSFICMLSMGHCKFANLLVPFIRYLQGNLF